MTHHLTSRCSHWVRVALATWMSLEGGSLSIIAGDSVYRFAVEEQKGEVTFVQAGHLASLVLAFLANHPFQLNRPPR